MAIQSFRRGLRELLENEFIYRSPVTDTYFVNVNFIVSGALTPFFNDCPGGG
jgi:hypothetical protein